MNSNDEENAFISLYLIVAACWYYVLNMTGYFNDESIFRNSYNILLYTGVLTSFQVICYKKYAADWIIMVLTGIAAAYFINSVGYFNLDDNHENIESIFEAFILGAMCALSLGGFLSTSLYYLLFSWISPKKTNSENAQWYDADDEPKQNFNDDDYAYDRGGFSGNSNQSNNNQSSEFDTANMPYGVDKRHPEDAKNWAVVDDPGATDNERIINFRTILKRAARRQGKAGTDLA